MFVTRQLTQPCRRWRDSSPALLSGPRTGNVVAETVPEGEERIAAQIGVHIHRPVGLWL